MKEIEILVEVNCEFEKAKKILSQFEFHGEKCTKDTYFFDPLRDSLKLNSKNKLMACCRIREKNGRFFVAYKSDIYEGEKWLYSEEHETEVSQLKPMVEIFNSLGLKELVTVDNTKHTYTTGDYEIVLEVVKDLGVFLEVEYMCEDTEDVHAIKNGIYEFLNNLGLEVGDELNSGKPELLLTKVKLE